jgi:FixJ family two-component response regulator
VSAPVVSIVDDDDAVRTALARLLRLEGFAPRAFASAEEFLQSGELLKTRCVLTDIRMPGMSGRELSAAMVARGITTPVIFMTAYREEPGTTGSVSGEVVLTKPFDPNHVIASVRAAVNGR